MKPKSAASARRAWNVLSRSLALLFLAFTSLLPSLNRAFAAEISAHLIIPAPEQFFGYTDREPLSTSLVDMDAVRAAAASGEKIAQFQASISYLRSYERDRIDLGIHYLKASAAQDYAPAQYNLAVEYILGLHIPQNLDEAFRLFIASAAQDFAPAQRQLARMHADGHGAPKNAKEALRFLEAAAAGGDQPAQKALANAEAAAARSDKGIRTIAKPRQAWSGPVIDSFRAIHTDVTLMANPCPAKTKGKWRSARMFLRPGGPLNPIGSMWAACWRQDPATPSLLNVCPFDTNLRLLGGLGACEFPVRRPPS